MDEDKSLALNEAQKKTLDELKNCIDKLVKSNVGFIGDQYGNYIYAISLNNVDRCWSNDDLCLEEDGEVCDVDVVHESPDVEAIYIPFVATLDFVDTSFGVQYKKHNNQ